MADEQSQTATAPPPPRQQVRRSSFAGQTFADLFGTGRPRETSNNSNNTNNNNNSNMTNGNNNNSSSNNSASPPGQQQYPGPITTAAAQAQQRRMSLTTLGLSGANGQTSPFSSYRGRGDSFGSNSPNGGTGAVVEESAIVEDDGGGGGGAGSAGSGNGSGNGNTSGSGSGTGGGRPEMGSSPITRRTSFGARALRDIRRGSMTGAGNGAGGEDGVGALGSSPPAGSRNAGSNGGIAGRDAKGREGFNWSDNFRTRVERTSSISGGQNQQAGLGVDGGTSPRMSMHGRAKSVAVMEPPAHLAAQQPPPPAAPAAAPVAVPKQQQQPVAVRPDHFQERILKGDFYMD